MPKRGFKSPEIGGKAGEINIYGGGKGGGDSHFCNGAPTVEINNAGLLVFFVRGKGLVLGFVLACRTLAVKGYPLMGLPPPTGQNSHQTPTHQ